MKTIVEIRQNHRGRGKTERDVSLSCAFYRSYFVFYLNLYSNQPFSIVYSERKVNITALVTLKLPHYIFNKRSYFGAAAGGWCGGGVGGVTLIASGKLMTVYLLQRIQ